jgi:hypothetical protein
MDPRSALACRVRNLVLGARRLPPLVSMFQDLPMRPGAVKDTCWACDADLRAHPSVTYSGVCFHADAPRAPCRKTRRVAKWARQGPRAPVPARAAREACRSTAGDTSPRAHPRARPQFARRTTRTPTTCRYRWTSPPCHSGNASASVNPSRRAISPSIIRERRWPRLTRDTEERLVPTEWAMSVRET